MTLDHRRAPDHRPPHAWSRRLTAAICGLMALLGWSMAAEAGGDPRGMDMDRRRPTACQPVVYAQGCYWRRGERYCSRYCYIEVNGKRYCSQRQREAVPQAACEAPEVPELNSRRPHHRHRSR